MTPPPKVAAVVLAYRPSSSIRDNLAKLAAQADHIYLVNNSPDDEGTEKLLAPLRDGDALTVLDQTKNVGVAAGFNAGMRQALGAGFDYVWVFDQDSTVADGMLEALIGAFSPAGRPVAIAGPALRAEETGHLYDGENRVGVEEQVAVISSGALFSRAALEKIGLHDERLFIDYVDHDISLRARRAGYRVVKVYDTVLDHRFGDSVPSTFLGRRIYLSNYSPMRQYYMTRNRMIMIRRYGFGRWFWDDAAYATKAWIKMLLCERERGPKIRAGIRGFIDGARFRQVRSTVG
ncbi:MULTISPECIES: glycosyltransferase family 2 protein [Microbacterium]|uniref:glycosyltransferase family 2 protein n=1 Tax=Microbacterium TaxID=33882 RepID=UPI00141EB4BE|nr:MULTISPECIES: glycosyltransferase family 2 protein [Microbacterium]NIG64823.1 glycosyltransferase [Microbacterium sp. Be9]